MSEVNGSNTFEETVTASGHDGVENDDADQEQYLRQEEGEVGEEDRDRERDGDEVEEEVEGDEVEERKRKKRREINEEPEDQLEDDDAGLFDEDDLSEDEEWRDGDTEGTPVKKRKKAEDDEKDTTPRKKKRRNDDNEEEGSRSRDEMTPKRTVRKRKPGLRKSDKKMVDAFIERMKNAYLEDKRSYNNQQPGFAKAKLLPEVQSFFLLQGVRESLFTERNEDNDPRSEDKEGPVIMTQRGIMVLRVTNKWLSPLPDGSLPNLKVREGLLKSLEKLDLGVELLRKSGIGKAVMTLSKHKDETNSNKKICRNLIQKWIRPIFSISSTYSQLEEVELEAYERKKQQLLQRNNADKLKRRSSSARAFDEAFEAQSSTVAENNIPRYTVRPEKVRMDYVVRPPIDERLTEESSQSERGGGGSGKTKHKFQEKLQALKMVKKGRSRAVSVGVNRPTQL